MRALRRSLVVAVLAGAVVLAATVPTGAGIAPVITGTTSCDPATGTTTISWNIQSDAAATVVATQTPSGEVLTVTTNPLSVGSNTATGTVPVTTVGIVTLSVAVVGGPTFTGLVTVAPCLVAAPAVSAAADFTG
jgi:hypothetical protein